MAPLPRIAFFHGGGSSSRISEIQCSALQQDLSSAFEFVFFDAPFERDAGPGVLPYFTYEEFGPYRTWFAHDAEGVERLDGREAGNGEGRGEGGIERVVRLMKERGEGGDWVACMGFSQGTRVVGGLLLEQQRLREAGLPGLGNGAINFRFGVLCMGTGAPMVVDSSNCESQIVTWVRVWLTLAQGSNSDLISIPTIHLHGLKDAILELGRKQVADHFDPRTSTVVEIDYHHAMPWNKADLLKFEEAILTLYKQTRGGWTDSWKFNISWSPT
jgi:hypothetical protein